MSRNQKPFIIKKTQYDSLNTYLKNALNHIGALFSKQVTELILKGLSESFIHRHISEIINWSNRKNLRVSHIQDSFEEGDRNSDEILLDLFHKPAVRNKFEKVIINAFLASARKSKSEPEYYQQRIREIQRIFSLSEMECRIMNLLYRIETDLNVNQLVETLNEYLSVHSNRYRSILNEKTAAILLGCHRSDVHKTFFVRSPLVRLGILDEDRELSFEILHYLEGLNDKPLEQIYFSEYDGSSLPLKNYFINEHDVALVQNLFRKRTPEQGINILLYGKPGTGKTEFARSLASSLNAALYEIKNKENAEDKKASETFRIRALMACQNMVPNEDSIIIIDEADSLLNSRPGFYMFKETTEKGLINKTLDDNITFSIWIVNYLDGMDESTRRRFDYAIQFESMNLPQRIRIWQNLIRKHRMSRYLSKSQITKLAEAYDISAGEIANAMHNTRIIHTENRSEERIINTIEQFLQSYTVLKSSRKTNEQKTRIQAPEVYRLNGLNLNIDSKHFINTVKQFSKNISIKEAALPENLNVLFYGPSGTGKTGFAGYIARILKKKLIIKTSADLLSHWVGMTEKNIREAFLDAQREQAVLFFDEIDSLLITLDKSMHSWEVTQVNELLTCMEQYKGIFLAATNHMDLVDNAAIRRFSFKIHFDYLKPSGNLIFYNALLKMHSENKLTPEERRRITSIGHLTPGDFKVVSQMYRFGQGTSHKKLISALEQEAQLKSISKTSIGFN